MAHANISIFIPHMGCPNACSFCNQRTISASAHAPTAAEAEKTIREAYEYISSPEKRADTEIAFFGGSFTAIDREYMLSLLETAHRYVKTPDHDGFRGIRISTRPDCIDEEILMLLKKYGVTAIELGAQSMDDEVLSANDRGHTAEDVRKASRLIRSYGFELGLQMMTGLYKSTPEKELATMEEIIALSPATVRIYPVAVLRNTRLAELYESGGYTLYPFDECIRLCAYMLGRFTEHGIKVIRIGLHAEDGVEENAVAGYYHAALGELVRSELARQHIEKALTEKGHADCEAHDSMMSILTGHKRSNKTYFSGKSVTFARNDSVPRKHIRINGCDILFQ